MTNTFTYGLLFNNCSQYKNAQAFVFRRHPDNFKFDDRKMILWFFTNENRQEMKQIFDIFGWKCIDFLE